VSDATRPMDRPTFGPQGEPCANCGALLARDQRYCLECGTRRAGMGALLSDTRDPRQPSAAERTLVAQAPLRVDSPWRLDAGLLAGVGCLLLALLVGVLIGRSGGGDAKAPAAQVVTVPGTAPAGATTGAPAAFTSDWPAGKRGFTVQLQSLPKNGTDAAAVTAAKQAAAGKGAPGVGALDTDALGSLDPGRYLIYSGQYASRKAATAALGKLKSRFPEATVVEVATQAQRASSGGGGSSHASGTGKVKAPSKAEQAAGSKAIQDIQSATGKDYSKKSAKLPKTLVTPGKAPPKDNKPAGGGSGSQTFK
jgi:hypothetical protein